MVDTCAAEFEAKTPYYYGTYEGEDEVTVSNNKKVVILEQDLYELVRE